jgi:hypothetical protein
VETPIIVAFGIEFRDYVHRRDLETYLGKLAKKGADGVYHYKKGSREYAIQLVFSKKAFLQALDTPDAIVIYDGHSRFGQGPAFVEKAGVGACPSKQDFPQNPWGDHVRMGWDVVLVTMHEEILHHCTDPKEYATADTPTFAPAAVRYFARKARENKPNCKSRKVSKRKLLDCFPDEARVKNGRGDQTLLKRSFWYTTARDSDFFTLVEGGSADLRKSSLKCQVLFMNSCSSAEHYFCSLSARKRETKSKCVFYLTQRLAFMGLARTTNIFIDLILQKGVDPTNRKGAKQLVKTMNAVNPRVLKEHKIPDASGLIDFYTGKEKMECPSWKP